MLQCYLTPRLLAPRGVQETCKRRVRGVYVSAAARTYWHDARVLPNIEFAAQAVQVVTGGVGGHALGGTCEQQGFENGRLYSSDEVLSLLSLLVQKYMYLLFWYQSTNTDAVRRITDGR